MMTTKDYLKRALGLEDRIKALQADIKVLCATPGYKSPADVHERVQGGVRGDATADPVYKMMERVDKLKGLLMTLQTEKADFLYMFTALPDAEEGELLKLRYIKGIKLDLISYKLQRSYESTRKLSAKAIKDFETRWSYVYEDL